MARMEWDWRPQSRGAQDIANLHVCLALLRIYRGVQLPVSELDSSAAARPFWPLLRLHPQAFRDAVAQYRPRASGARRSRRRAGPSDEDMQNLSAELAACKVIPVEPTDALEAIGEAMLSDARAFRPLLDAVDTTLADLVAARPMRVEPKIRMLARMLGLTRYERAFLRLCVAAQTGSIATSAFSCARAPNRLIEAVRVVTGAPDEHAVRTMLRRTSPLVRSGLLHTETVQSCHDLEDLLRLSRQGMLLFSSPADTLAEMAQVVLQRMPDEAGDELQWPHLEDRTALIAQLLAAALREGRTGINILLHGAPGTGKTQYAQRLVRQIGALGFMVADKDADGDAASRSERLSSLMLTQVFAPGKKSVVILDEAEDVFQADYNNPFARAMGKREESKSWMNSLLEGNRRPVVWISNRIEHLDPAYLRRFTYCLEFPQTPRRVRAQIARQHLEPVGCSGALIQEVAASQAVSPALMASASQFATLAALRGSAVDTGVRTMLKDMVSALGGEFQSRLPERATRYDTRYLNVRPPTQPHDVLDALDRTRRGRVLMSGPPGTGKTQLAAEAAMRLGREMVYRTASDINSMWFGESERNVARMFKDCDPATEVLFLDEAEALLGSRESAHNRAEQAVTAEFLRHLESFPGVFLCATNHQGRLDAALLRRFEFRLAFEPLTALQRLELLAETAMGWRPESGNESPAPDVRIAARLDRLDQLTPGDFANVVRRLKSLGIEADAERMVQELEAEHAAKPGAARRSIGFV